MAQGKRLVMLLARPDLIYAIVCSSFLTLAAHMLRMFSVTENIE